MKEQGKAKIGLKGTIIRRPFRRIFFSEEDKHLIIRDYLSSGLSKQAIWEKYTGYTEEHGQIIRWMRNYGYESTNSSKKSNFTNNISTMSKKKKVPEQPTIEDFETLQLKKRIEELENQLKDAEMKAIAFSTMVDIAEKEYNIPIRKKYNTKPSKK